MPFEVDGDMVRLTLQSAVYSELAIQKAAYRLAAACSAHIRLAEDDFLVSLVSKSSHDVTSAHQLLGDFLRHLNDEVLREKIASQTKGIRELLLAHAFSRTGLVAE